MEAERSKQLKSIILANLHYNEIPSFEVKKNIHWILKEIEN